MNFQCPNKLPTERSEAKVAVPRFAWLHKLCLMSCVLVMVIRYHSCLEMELAQHLSCRIMWSAEWFIQSQKSSDGRAERLRNGSLEYKLGVGSEVERNGYHQNV